MSDIATCTFIHTVTVFALMFVHVSVHFRARLHVVEYQQHIEPSPAHWLSMNESKHPSNLSLTADLGSLPYNCRFIHTTHSPTVNGSFVCSLRIPLIFSLPFFHFRVQIKWRETWCENWTLLSISLQLLYLHLHFHRLWEKKIWCSSRICVQWSKSWASTVFQSLCVLCRTPTWAQ